MGEGGSGVETDRGRGSNGRKGLVEVVVKSHVEG